MDVLRDLRLTLRQLRRQPGFVAVSVFTLALAIAVGTSLFTAVNGFFYRPLPVPGGAELVSVFTSNSGGEARGGSSYRDLADFARAAAPVAQLTSEARLEAAVGNGENVALLSGALVSSNYFATLRVTPTLGRFPVDARDDEPTIVLGYGLWRRAFASDPSAVGRAVRVNGQFFRVAAVAPREFLGTMREFVDEFWIDARFSRLLLPGEDVLNGRGNRRFHVVARLHDGASLGALQARLGIVAARLYAEYPEEWSEDPGRGRRVTAQRERDARLAGVPGSDLLLVVGGVTAMGLGLLALASANLASLQMARAAARRREIATRLALGAGRRRIVRQLLTETAVVAIPGGVLGLALAATASAVAVRYRPAGLPNVDLALDLRTLLFVTSGVLLALLVFGLVPALQSLRGEVHADLRGPEGVGRRGIRVGGIRGGLIVAQVALSVTFTAGSTLIVLALARYAGGRRVEATRVLVAPITLLPGAGDSLRAAALVRDIVAQLDEMPGIEAASAARYVPNMGERMTVQVTQQAADRTNAARSVDANAIRPRYFEVIGLRLLRGRDFDARDMSVGAAPVAIVSSVLAERLWPGADPIGRVLRMNEDGHMVEIIGLVDEQRSATTTKPGEGLLYLPMTGGEGRLVLHLRVSGGGAAEALAPSVARALRAYNAGAVASDVEPLADYMNRALIPQRVAARASGVLALLQLALAVTGLSGLVAYVTAQRRREIGIRSALGAGRPSILALVLRQGVRLTLIGGAIGMALSIAVGQVVATTLPVNAAIQLVAPAAAAACFALVAVAAMLWLARRALGVAPATALRVE
ncbi:MacB-like periplasmic core domain protein (plasmid) [Gemmatirosa kalamazoonensis]|uniref:MacB-like periplasmic core domain protein n=1 Tax=Gemmatirosa kalamazoonensis TaxID=861299 RepID=W0RQS5_9BACT|nr:ABC transporter permease [Gemmatirosa kalamazoonensis]AHG93066.1 MacB-like periplasmic core domain protein [Gemmatirosa kalamazoonensis]